MAQEPVKPINEIERKTWVSDQDLILILDSSTGEARLADKEELRGIWIQDIAKAKSGRTTTITFHTTDKKSYQIKLEDGDDWLTPQFALEQTVFKRKFPNEEAWKTLFDIESFRGEKGEDGKNPEFKFSGTHIQRRLQGEKSWNNLLPIDELKGKAFTYEDFTPEQLEALRGGKGDKGEAFKFEDFTPEQLKKLKGDKGDQGRQWDKGDQGRQWDKGDPWESPEFRKTNDFLQIKLPSERTWKNLIPLADITWPAGSGSGDMLKSENLSWLTNKEQARTNLGVYSIDQITELLRDMLTSENLNSVARTLSGLVIIPWNWSGSASLYLRHPNGRTYEFFSDGNGAFGVWDKTSNTDVFRITPTETLLYKPLSSRNMRITSVWDPTQPKDATNKQYVDNKLNTKADLVAWKVPTNQLPSYVDDVLEFDTREAFPTTWEKGKIYIAINDDSQWRWTGTAYKKMVSSPWSTDAIPEGSQNLYFTPERAKGAVQSDLNGKADLVGGKVPASQLPEVSQIDESNLVHKSWDETIGGIKKLTNIIKKSLNQKNDNYDEETAGVSYRQEWGGSYKRWLDFFAHGGQNQLVGGSGFRFLWNRPGSNALDVIMALVHWHLTFNWTITSQHFNTKQDWKTNWINIWKEWDMNRIDSYNDSSWFVDLNIRAKKLNFEWSSILSNGQDWTGEWQSRTPTCGSSTITKHHCRYKVIGKTCYFLVEVYINNVQWETPWFTLPVVRKNYNTEFPIAGYCARRWEHPVKDSRWVLSFNGSNRISTLNSVDMWVLIQSWEYIVRANWCYEIE